MRDYHSEHAIAARGVAFDEIHFPESDSEILTPFEQVRLQPFRSIHRRTCSGH